MLYSIKYKKEIVIYFLACIFGVAGCIMIQDWYFPDEYFQIFEFVSVRWGDTPSNYMMWEYFAEVRPALQPLIVYIFHKIFSLFGITNPFVLKTFISLLTNLFAIYTISRFNRVLMVFIREKYRIFFIFLSVFSHFIFFYNQHFSAEVMSGLCFVWGLIFLFESNRDNTSVSSNRLLPILKVRNFVFCGIFFALAFVLRLQIAFAILGLFLWLWGVVKIPYRYFLYSALAFLGVYFVCGFVIDRWYYGHWVWTHYNYYDYNVLRGKAAGSGISDAWFYFLALCNNIFPLQVLLFFTIYFVLRFYKHSITWIVVVFLLEHHMTPHKELRFLIPLMYFSPFIFMYSWQDIMEYLNRGKEKILKLKCFYFVERFLRLGKNFNFGGEGFFCIFFA